MARGVFSTRPRRGGLVQRYLDEVFEYGGELWRRGDIILELKRLGLDQGCIDRYLQGMEHRKQVQERHWNMPTDRVQ